MKRLTQSIFFLVAAAAIGAVLCAAPARALDSTFVALTDHPEEALTWCGAATGQMVIGGYPASACTPVQADVWAAIQAHKVEGNYDTDPAGLRDAMMTLCPPPGGHFWVVFAQPTAANLMHSVAFWMKTNHYPVAVLLSTVAHNSIVTHREHWVTIRGIVTDVDPVTHPTIVLQNVLIVDQPTTFGNPAVERFLTGTQWYAEFQAVSTGGPNNGKFVAVIEPPKKTGRAIAKERLMVGKVIDPQRAVAQAKAWLGSSGVAKVESFRELTQLQPQQPVLVNPERGGYYIIPYGAAEKPAPFAVLVNAYSGDVLEAGRVNTRLLDEKEAVRNALRFLGRETAKESKAALISSPEAGSPYTPVWRVTIDQQELFVQSNGNVRAVISPKP
jgi:hypothetical protein